MTPPYKQLLDTSPPPPGQLYLLKGLATTPTPEGTITATIPAKTTSTHVLNVRNWLRQAQRFRIEVVREAAAEST